MKITIDTKQDSHEDMKHVLEMLTNLLQKGSSEPVDTGVMMGMFDSEPAKEEPAVPMTMFNTPVKESSDSQLFGMSQNQQEVQKKDTGADFSALLNLQEKKDDNDPQVEVF